jgi:hypothetical protein
MKIENRGRKNFIRESGSNLQQYFTCPRFIYVVFKQIVNLYCQTYKETSNGLPVGRDAKGVDVWHGVFKAVEDCRRPPSLRAGHPRNDHKAVSGMAHPQGVEG